MTIAPLLIVSAVKRTLHLLREIAYSDMALQASGWISEESRVGKQKHDNQPIKLDFAVPKKHRLNWIRRTMQHLPH